MDILTYLLARLSVEELEKIEQVIKELLAAQDES